MRFFTLIPLLLVFPLSAARAETIDEKAEVINDQTEWRLRDKANQEALDKKLQLSTPPIQLPKVEALPPPVKENICFVINSIKIQGILSDWAKKQGQNYIGQCVGMEGIQTYIRLINKQLLSQGYMTSRAILPEQNLASKVLTIKILEGIIEAIEFPSHYRFNWQHSLPLKVGNILNLRDMEQAVDQLNRLQSQNIEFKVQPGKQSNGSILVAEVKESKRWNINGSIDNSGSSSTGEYPVSVSGGFDNVFFIQDSLTYSLSLARYANIGESRSASITWEVPVGYWLFKLNKTYSDYQQQQEGTVTNFELTGNSNDNKISINYVLSRDNKTKVSLFNYLKTRERHSFIDGTEIEVQQLNLTEIEAGINFRQYIGRSVLDISLSGHKGLERLGADSVNNDEDNTELEQPNYRFYSLVSSFNHPFSVFEKNLSYSAQFFAQYTDVAIYSLDWFSIGGRYTVRGYESDQGLSSDKGWRLKNDISLPIRISQYAATSYLGFDIGQVFGEGIEDENESENTLAGLTLGIKGKLLGANYDLFVSTPFLAYGPYASASDYTISASLSAQF